MIKITIEAPQGWGKTWFAERLADEIRHWKGENVTIIDGSETRLGARVPCDVLIVTKQTK